MKAGELRGLIVLGLVLCFLNSPVSGLVLYDGDYEFETYAMFEADMEGRFRGMTFGPDGDLYVTWYITQWGRDGVVYEVSPTGVITEFATDLVRPTCIIWADDPNYGDYFYVCDPYERVAYDKGIVVQIAPDGTTTTFAGPYLNDPVSLAIDPTGAYGHQMYVGNGSWDRIMTVSAAGETEMFYSIGDCSGSPRDITFDGNGEYGWLMYVSTIYTTEPDISGIIMFDPLGNLLGRFAPEIVGAYQVEFDEAGTMFDGDMYVRGFNNWDGSEWIWRVQPDGSCEQFCLGKYRIFTFGPDGAMYVLERVDGVPTIQRVYRKLSLLERVIENIEEAIAEKGVALEAVETSLANEQAAYAILGEMLDSGDYGDFTRQDIAKAIKKLKVSIAEQGRVIRDLEDSIARLEDALMLLGVE